MRSLAAHRIIAAQGISLKTSFLLAGAKVIMVTLRVTRVFYAQLKLRILLAQPLGNFAQACKREALDHACAKHKIITLWVIMHAFKILLNLNKLSLL